MDKNTIGFVNNENEIKTKDFWVRCPDMESEYDSQSKWKKFNSTPADFANCVHIHHCKNFEPKDNTSDCVGGYVETTKSLITKFDKIKYSETIKDIKQHLNNGNPIHARTILNNLIIKLGYE